MREYFASVAVGRLQGNDGLSHLANGFSKSYCDSSYAVQKRL